MTDIDFVIAWVDGSDPVHAEARRRFNAEREQAYFGAATDSRFRDNGEIYYLIASILKYAPFTRRVFVVTDNQKPALLDSFADAGLCERSFLQLVSHDTIFRGLDVARPTFNPRPIEAALWRVPELAEQFVYSNDDMFLNAPLSPDIFFRNGRPVLGGDMVRPERLLLKNRLRRLLAPFTLPAERKPRHRSAQEKGAFLAGVRGRFFYTGHHPHPLRRSTFEKFYSSNPEALKIQMKYRYRNLEQHSPVALANNLEIAEYDTPRERRMPVSYLRPAMSGIDSALSAMRGERVPFGCVQNLDKFPERIRVEIHGILQEKFRDFLPEQVRSYLSGRSARSKTA